MIKAIGGGLLALASLTFYGYGLLDPNSARWAIVSVLLGLALLFWAERPWWPSDKLSAAIFCLLAYVALSIIWSPDWREGLLRLYSIVLAVGVFFLVRSLPREPLKLIIPWIAVGSVGMMLVNGYLHPDSYGGMANQNYRMEFLVFVFPFLVYGAWVSRGLLGFCSAVSVTTVVMMALFFGKDDWVDPIGRHYGGDISDVLWAGLAGYGAAFTFLLFIRGLRKTALLIALLAVGGVLVALQSERILEAFASRVEYAHNTLMMWWDHPLFGVGLGGYNYFYPFYQEAHLWLLESDALGANGGGSTRFVGAAHNEILQFGATFGVVGLVLLGVVVSRFRGRLCDRLAVAAFVSFSAVAGASLIGFPFQNPNTVIIALASLGLMAPPGSRAVAPRWPARAGAGLLVAAAFWVGWASIEAGRQFSAAHFRTLQGDYLSGFRHVKRAYAAMPLDMRYRLQFLASLEILRSGRENTDVSIEAADRAYELSASASPRHPSVLIARGGYLIDSGRWKHSDEIKEIVSQLETGAALLPESWLVITAYKGLSGDEAGAIRALITGLERHRAVYANGGPIENWKRVAALANLRIEER